MPEKIRTVTSASSATEWSWHLKRKGASERSLSYAPILSTLLRKKKPYSYREWGSGLSTLLAAQSMRRGVIVSIDWDAMWMKRVEDELEARGIRDRVMFVLQSSGVDGDCRPYSAWPVLNRISSLDFAFVNGRQRVECCTIASLVLADDGCIVLNESHREGDADARGLFRDWRETTAMCGSKIATMARPRRKIAWR